MTALQITADDAPDDASLAACMAVMACAFDPEFGEAWTAGQLRSMLSLPGTVLIIGRQGDQVIGFGLLRNIVQESELLLLAVDPQYRAIGHGRRLLDRCLMIAERSGSETIFLEVRDSNPAVHLYIKAGFSQYNQRKDYYVGISGCRYDALSLKAVLVQN
jgi:[ribosomal protein S18]-alanine N-acetyltransferase